MKGFWEDFTFVQIAILVSLVATLAIVTIPNYRTFLCRSQQSEAKHILSQVHAVLHLFKAEHDQFTTLNHLIKSKRIQLKNDLKYEYFSVVTTDNSFVVQARGLDEKNNLNDVWTIDQDHNLINTTTICQKSSNKSE